MEPSQNGIENEEDCQGADEEEEVDPRIKGELEKLNQSTDDINRWESELEEFRQRFRAVLVEATVKLDEQVKKIGRAVDDSKPYWEARKVARQAQVEAQKATQEFQRAVEILRAAKETIALAEERLLEEDSRQFDSAWQEMLNHATQRVMEAEQSRTRSEAEHKSTAANYTSCVGHMKQLEKKLKRSITKSKPYFELKAKYYLQLEQLKRQVDERQAKLVVAKAEYRAALRSLENISEEIHAQRRSVGTRGRGVGAELDGEGFAVDFDGLSMVSVCIDDDSEEDAQSAPSSPSASATLDVPSPPSPTSLLHIPSSPSSPSSSSSSCPGALEVSGPFCSHGSDSPCGSAHGSPLLGPRSQCSGASSPDCDQERGDRAEGAEATLEGNASSLNLTVAHTQPDTDVDDKKEKECVSDELPSPSNIP
uniref:SH3 domain-binding protein 5 n=1 Tax=Hippocampus comes TaxID=109280 RepID=A0A3Q2YS10_HIPCM